MLRRLKDFIYHQYPLLSVASNYLGVARDMRRYGIHLTPFGFKFMGPRKLQDGLYEPEETALLRSYLRKSTVFIDIGANMGYYTCLARHAGLKVLAVEPLLYNLEYLYINLETNGYFDVEVFPFGLAAYPGLAPLYGPGTAASLIRDWGGTSTKKRIIPLSTLDIIIGDRFADEKLLIKIDIEGAEYEMLKGSEKTLTAFPDSVWMVEIVLSGNHPSGQNPNFLKTFETFWSHGFKTYTTGKDPRPVSQNDVAMWIKTRMQGDNFNFLFTKGKEKNKILENNPAECMLAAPAVGSLRKLYVCDGQESTIARKVPEKNTKQHGVFICMG
jgi:FkbM family methyltransferase